MKTPKQIETVYKSAYSYIRFSTPDQEMGDSERRQVAGTKALCEQMGWKLAETAADKGVSGYHGRNHEKGALGRLLKQMPPCSVLIIEDCDRWSREPVLDALTRLRDAVRRGIGVYFRRTGTLVTASNFDDLGVMTQNFFSSLLGHEESKKKSERIAANWENKRELARAGKPVRMNRMPCWLQWDTEQEKAVVNETRAAVVRRMYAMACQGNGILEICKAMRNTPPLTIPRKKAAKIKPAWNQTTVRNILTNRATIGYCTSVEPHAPDVWPAIISEETFAVAQSKLNITKLDKRPGHKSELNLFTGLALCGCCKQNNLISHWSGGKRQAKDGHHGDARLICGGAGSGRSNCGYAGVPLRLVENSLLSFLGDADLIRPLLTTKDQKPSKLSELEARHAEAEKQAAKLAKLILGDDDPSPMLYSRLKQEESRAKTLKAEIEQEQIRERAERPALQSYNEFVSSLPALAADTSKRPELRRAVATVLQKIVADPHGDKGTWTYTVHLKCASEPVEVCCVSKPEGWCYRSLRPAKYAPVNGNVIAA